MKARRNIAFSAALTGALATGSPAGAQESPFSGVWVSDERFCPLIEEIGTRAIFGNGIAIITLGQGYVGHEFFCDFEELEFSDDGRSVEIAATCADSAESFADTIRLNLQEGEKTQAVARFELNSPLITGRQGPETVEEAERFVFARCDNLTETMLAERSEP